MDKAGNLNPSNILENSTREFGEFAKKIVDDNQDLLSALDKDTDFQQAYNAIKDNNRVLASVNRDMMALLYADETVPGEQSTDEYRYIDPLYSKPIGARVLRNGGRTEGARLIKNTRSLQFTAWGKPSFEKKDPGLTIVHPNKHYKFTSIEKEKINTLLIALCDKFFVPPHEYKSNLTKWLGAAYNDWFDLDDVTFEIGRNGLGFPIRFQLHDPVLVKEIIPDAYKRFSSRLDYLNDKDVYAKLADERTKKIFRYGDDQSDENLQYILMKNQKEYMKCSSYRMVKSHFFITTDYNLPMRGYSVMEQGLRMISNITNSITYNATNFSNNRTPPGMVAFTGGFANRLILDQFRKVLYAYLSGANQRHKIPVIGLPEHGDAKFIPFNANSHEMEYHLWITLLFTILCQLSGTSPEEISMSSHESAMRGKQPFDKAPDGILQVSRDKGLNTFLNYMADLWNKTDILKQILKMDVRFAFNGLIVEDESVKATADKTKLSTTSSLNDIITEGGGDSQTLMLGDKNVYDIKAPDSPIVTKAVDALIQIEQAKISLQQQQLAQESELANQQQPTNEDIIGKYGTPENGQ